jgi:UDP-N-acetylmuramoylalanine--D-glutamate ligase
LIDSQKINSNKITIIGSGETGISAALLAAKNGKKVFLSELNTEKIDDITKNKLISKNIEFEIGEHSEKVFDSSLWVLSPGVPSDLDFVLKAKEMGILVISEIEFASWYTKKPIIGITGSNGKTTTVNLIQKILKSSHLDPVLAGNVGYAFSRAILRDLNDEPKERVYILELSSFQLENILYFKPMISVILNISPDHLDRHKNMDSYINAKLNIFKNQDERDYLIYNSNDSILSKKCQKALCRKIEFGLSKSSRSLLEKNGSKVYDNEIEVLNLNNALLKGGHNHLNVLAAASAVKLLDVNNKIIEKEVLNFSGIEHRMEKVISKNGITYYNDSKATNIEAVIAAISSFSGPVILILGGKDKDTDFSSLIPHIRLNVKRIISYGQAGKKISITLRDAVELDQVFSLRDAVELCLKSAVPGDTVLLSPGCASFDQYENFEERGNAFKRLVNKMAQA